MCRADIPEQDEGDSLETRGEVIIRGEGDNAWKIEHPETGSFFRTLAGGDRQSGPRPAAVLADEIHEFRTDTALKTWEEAIAKVAGSSMMVMGTNTPATAQHVGTSYSDHYQDIALGKLALLAAGKLEEADAVLASADRAAQIEWEYALTFERDNPLIAQVGGALGLSEEQIDDLFRAAAAL
jgi:phage terminase large subunit-like protein